MDLTVDNLFVQNSACLLFEYVKGILTDGCLK